MDANTNHGPGHETSDINVWAIGKFAIALVVITVLSLALLFGLFRYFETNENPSVAVDPVRTFPAPQVQKQPRLDLKEFREEEDKLLNSYGWVDREKGIVHVPVNQAIDMLAKKGLK